MENKIELKNCVIDFENFEQFNEIKQGAEIFVYSDTWDILAYCESNEKMDGTIFGLWIQFGKNKERTIMFDVEIDELEMFACSLQKHIEIIRGGLAEQIKKQQNDLQTNV